MKQYNSDLDVLLESIEFKGKTIVDIGCGDGSKAKHLVSQGATVIGIEPNLESWQVKEFESEGFKMLSGGAEKLGLEDKSVDVVVFMYSLHHVPNELMRTAMLEARRVLKNTGVLYIAEPIAKGSYQDVCEPFIDETLIRDHAISAVEQFAIPQFESCDEFEYQVSEYFDDFGQFFNEMMRYSLERYEKNHVDNDEVRALFEKTIVDNRYRLDQPVKCWLLYNTDQNLKGAA